MNKKILLIIVLICSSKNIIASDIFITINETQKNIKSVNVNGNIFVNYEQFFKLLNENLKISSNNYNLSYKNIKITAYPMNFYVLLSNDTNECIIQLNTPIYVAQDILYIPINSLLSALKEFFGISYDILRNEIYIDFGKDLINYFTTEVNEDIQIDLTKVNNFSIAHNYSLEHINKPALSSLSYSNRSFIISRQERQLFDRTNIEDIMMESNSNLPSLLPSIMRTENKSLPPFRKFSIPEFIKKEKIEELK